MSFRNPGLPLPPDGRQIPIYRESPIRSLKAAMRVARPKQRPLPRLAPVPPLPKPQKQQPIPGQVYKPPSQGKSWTTDPREIMALISRFARERKVIIIRYKKATDGNRLVTRSVEPYALRYKNTKTRGRARFFYGFDVDGPTTGIHSFLIPNIVSVQGTETLYRPRWVVEF